MNVAAIRDEVLGLPATERAKLVDLLWNSLSKPGVTARETAWAEESEQRIDAFNTGKLTARDAQEILSDLRSRQ